MRHHVFLAVSLAGVMVVSACGERETPEETVERAFESVNVVNESDLSDVMLTVADPNEAVTYFNRTVRENPKDIVPQRGLAVSLVRAKRYAEGASAFAKVLDMNGATNADRVDYADALLRAGDWATAEEQLDTVPPTHEPVKRSRLEAMHAGSNKEWKRAGSF